MKWKEYVGKKVSVLVIGKDNKQENWLGTIEAVVDGYLVLDCKLNDQSSFTIDKLIIKTTLIESVLIYK